MKKASPTPNDEQCAENKRSDFGKMVGGKYAGKIATASNVVVLDTKVSKAFPNDQAVNVAHRQREGDGTHKALQGTRRKKHVAPLN
jgi:hypothetical protein